MTEIEDSGNVISGRREDGRESERRRRRRRVGESLGLGIMLKCQENNGVMMGGDNRVDASEEWDIAVCGLNCARCGIYQAYSNSDREWQVRIAKSILGEDADIRPEMIMCGKCRGSLEIHWSGNCQLRTCAEQKGHRYCFQCEDFICEKLVKFSKTRHGRTVENMKAMKEIGLDAWLERQRKKGPAVICP